MRTSKPSKREATSFSDYGSLMFKQLKKDNYKNKKDNGK